MSANKYGHLYPETLRGVADTLEVLGRLGSEATGVYVDGRLSILHADGWRIGWAVHYEDWWYFEPDYGGEES